jgi:hypothetical protein
VRNTLSSLRFIESCLPTPADKSPSDSNRINEFRHAGYRLMVRGDRVGIRRISSRTAPTSRATPRPFCPVHMDDVDSLRSLRLDVFHKNTTDETVASLFPVGVLECD